MGVHQVLLVSEGQHRGGVGYATTKGLIDQRWDRGGVKRSEGGIDAFFNIVGLVERGVGG